MSLAGALLPQGCGACRKRSARDAVSVFYDVMVLAVAVAFLVRDGLRRGFQPYEWPLFALTFALLFSYLIVGAPTGFAATLVVVAIIAGRCGLFAGRANAAAAADPLGA